MASTRGKQRNRVKGTDAVKDEKRQTQYREGTGIVLACVTAFLTLSLASYHRADPSFNHTSPLPAENLAGQTGAYLADVLFQTMGWSAVLLPLLVGYVGIRMFRSPPLDTAWYRMVALPIFLASLCTLLTLLLPPPPLDQGLPAGPGGWLGIVLGRVMHFNFGAWGSLIVLLPLFAISFLLTTKISVVETLAKLDQLRDQREEKLTLEEEKSQAKEQLLGQVAELGSNPVHDGQVAEEPSKVATALYEGAARVAEGFNQIGSLLAQGGRFVLNLGKLRRNRQLDAMKKQAQEESQSRHSGPVMARALRKPGRNEDAAMAAMDDQAPATEEQQEEDWRLEPSFDEFDPTGQMQEPSFDEDTDPEQTNQNLSQALADATLQGVEKPSNDKQSEHPLLASLANVVGQTESRLQNPSSSAQQEEDQAPKPTVQLDWAPARETTTQDEETAPLTAESVPSVDHMDEAPLEPEEELDPLAESIVQQMAEKGLPDGHEPASGEAEIMDGASEASTEPNGAEEEDPTLSSLAQAVAEKGLLQEEESDLLPALGEQDKATLEQAAAEPMLPATPANLLVDPDDQGNPLEEAELTIAEAVALAEATGDMHEGPEGEIVVEDTASGDQQAVPNIIEAARQVAEKLHPAFQNETDNEQEVDHSVEVQAQEAETTEVEDTGSLQAKEDRIMQALRASKDTPSSELPPLATHGSITPADSADNAEDLAITPDLLPAETQRAEMMDIPPGHGSIQPEQTPSAPTPAAAALTAMAATNSAVVGEAASPTDTVSPSGSAHSTAGQAPLTPADTSIFRTPATEPETSPLPATLQPEVAQETLEITPPNDEAGEDVETTPLVEPAQDHDVTSVISESEEQPEPLATEVATEDVVEAVEEPPAQNGQEEALSEPEPELPTPIQATVETDPTPSTPTDTEAFTADLEAVTDAPIVDEVSQDVTTIPAVEEPEPAPLVTPPAPQKVALTSEEKYTLPDLSMLQLPDPTAHVVDESALNAKARQLEAVLGHFKVKGQIIDYHPGPVVTTYDLDPAPGLKSSKVVGISDDLARSISALSVRVVGNIPGKSVIGIEVPNESRETVYLREVLQSKQFKENKAPLAVALGSDIEGSPVVANLAKMPHLLVAGTTGSGKSVAVNAMICSILFHARPDEVRFLMVDPKMLELSIYEGIPHLLAPVVTDVNKSATLLKWAVHEMEERYRLMSEIGVRNLAGFNEKMEQMIASGEQPTRRVKVGFDPETGAPVERDEPIPLEKKPLIVIVIDELADLMIQVGKEVEPAIARLAQMARAAGLHLILATQRPSVDVITGLIKANFPTRLAFQVSSRTDSRTILDAMGADRLLGMGDGLYLPPGTSHLQRIHAPFVTDGEVHSLVNHWKQFGGPDYNDNVLIPREDEEGDAAGDDGSAMAVPGAGGGTDYDEFYDQAAQLIIRQRRVSTSMIQRHFKIGYNRAARIVEQMEEDGLISQANHQGKREVLAPEQPSMM
ncbi:DNA translocase FtsK [Magnetococcus sp. PR-3]|uniref:DNA translocase FtsK n=1 Tax=Magnetococcus sp. PR-3 TaxID=3120355 RepID=UPI002FCDEB00